MHRLQVRLLPRQPTNAVQYINCREIFESFIGQKLIDITQYDEQEFAETGEAYLFLMFENGSTMKITLGSDGIDIEDLEEE